MARPRTTNKHLPKYVSLQHGAFYYRAQKQGDQRFTCNHLTPLGVANAGASLILAGLRRLRAGFPVFHAGFATAVTDTEVRT